jgi:hypothetical protein
MSALPNLRSDLVAGIARDRARRRRRRLRAGAVALPLAVAAIAVSALLPAGSSRSPAQALAQATQQAADAAAGHIVWTITQTFKQPAANGATAGITTNDMRFQGEDVAIDAHNAQRQADGSTQTIDQASTRIVDGVLYYGNQDAPPTKIAADAHAGSLLAQETRTLDAMAAAARSAGDVAIQTDDDATTYTATIDAAGLTIPAGAAVVLPPGAKPDASDPDPKPIGLLLDGQAKLQVTVTDGAVSTFTLTQDDGRYTVHADLSELGQPQNITAP